MSNGHISWFVTLTMTTQTSRVMNGIHLIMVDTCVMRYENQAKNLIVMLWKILRISFLFELGM